MPRRDVGAVHDPGDLTVPADPRSGWLRIRWAADTGIVPEGITRSGQPKPAACIVFARTGRLAQPRTGR